MRTAEVASQPLRLMAELSSEGQANSTIPVRWCVSRETVKKFKEEGVKPYLLLVVSNNEKETDRYLVPVTDEMAYVRFRRPGKNLIHATLVWEGRDNPKSIVLGRNDLGRFRADIVKTQQVRADVLSGRIKELNEERDDLDYGDERRVEIKEKIQELKSEYRQLCRTEPETFGIRQDFDSIERLDYEVKLRVIVPAEMFAPEPPKWLKMFVGLFFKSGTVDQCHFRRRVIFSLLLAPLLGVYLMAKELVILGSLGILLFTGRRGINYRPVVSPMHHSPKDTWRNVHSSFWVVKKDGKVRKGPLVLFNPPLITVSFFVTFFATIFWSEASFKGDKLQEQHFDQFWAGTWWIYLIGVFAPLALYVVVLLVFLAGEALMTLAGSAAELAGGAKKTSLATKLRESGEKRRQVQRAKEGLQALETAKTFYASLEALSCNGDRKADLNALPKEQRTLHLRYQAVKAAVCRPYAK